jgi:signal transduction histidine kinase
LLDCDITMLNRYDSDRAVTVVGAWSKTVGHDAVPVGSQLPVDSRDVSGLVFESHRSTRLDVNDEHPPELSPAHLRAGMGSVVGAPINVQDGLWGVMVAATREEPLPSDTEGRLARFTELVATAIANAEAQEQVTASRARIVAAADQTRRRIGRDLHDGTQQRLVALMLMLRTARGTLPPEADELRSQLDRVVTELDGALDELREFARGIHPVTLARGGLPFALKVLADRNAVPVELDVRVDRRLPEHIEVAAYFAVSEALTNATKHASASVVRVEATIEDGGPPVLRVSVCDDGRGGASFGGGSGLLGLADRVEALSGRIHLDSPDGAGTTVRLALPLLARHATSAGDALTF